MKLSLALFAGAALGAGAVLFACASDDSQIAPGVDASVGGDAAPDAAPAVIEDAGTDTEKPDTSIPRPPFDAAAPEIVCAVTPCMKSIVGGPQNYCATDSTGVVRCWGNSGTLGAFVDAGDQNAGATPVVMNGLTGIRDIAIANYDTCAAGGDGGVACFGNSSQTPQAVPSVSGAVKLGLADDRRCAVTDTGALSCWGDNFATGTGPSTTTLAEPVVDVALHFSVGFALGKGGTLYSWGEERNMLGRTTTLMPDLVPAPVFGLPPAIQMASSDYHICALAEDGRLFCWGRADFGALGLGYIRPESFPVEVPFSGPAWPTQIAAAGSHSCARMSDGTLTCWAGSNSNGQLGYQAIDGVFQPTTVTSVKKHVASIAVGQASTCALLVDGSVQCWGDNSAGQLARGNRDSLRHPDPQTVVFP